MTPFDWSCPPAAIEAALEALLPPPEPQDELNQLHRALRSAVLGGGKRLRSQLVLESAAVVGGAELARRAAMGAACALELIHAYSLVHDDLPAMDNATTRRGLPSSHVQYGETTAILAGDGLLTLAFAALAATPAEVPAERSLRAVGLVAQAAGIAGMVGGQTIDMAWSADGTRQVDGPALLHMHSLKTGALIRCAAQVGALLGGGSEAQIENMIQYGANLGRAFQITDDLLDVTGDPQTTGKAASDSANDKITAPRLFGLQSAIEMAQQAGEAAVAALQGFGSEADTLRSVATSVVSRTK